MHSDDVHFVEDAAVGQLRMKAGSMGEMPPRTRGKFGFSFRMARPARMAISAKRAQSGSSSGSQWDLLLGSFQIITASIIAFPPCRIDRAGSQRAGMHAGR